MVKYVPDRTGRFFERPHYEPRELDTLCEQWLREFFSRARREIQFPIATDDLTLLIEQDVSDFDGFADLSRFGDGVEGVTEFLTGRKPRVAISARLAEDQNRENRYRTTLTHEYGHVRLHSYLFELEAPRRDLADVGGRGERVQICKRETIVSAAKTDWMEWQAGYVCGALLMPKSRLARSLAKFQERNGTFGPVGAYTNNGRALIRETMESFQVSGEAAKVRLSRLGYLATELGPSLLS